MTRRTCCLTDLVEGVPAEPPATSRGQLVCLLRHMLPREGPGAVRALGAQPHGRCAARLPLCPCWTPEQAESRGGVGASALSGFRILAEPLLKGSLGVTGSARAALRKQGGASVGVWREGRAAAGIRG